MKLIPIKKKKNYSYKGKVYDLNVNKDHTYNIDGHIVHNSDYVMLGSILNKALESAGDDYYKGKQITREKAEKLFYKNKKIEKFFRGMSTKSAQKAMGRNKFKTSEGVERLRTVEYTLDRWAENFEHYLRNAMSYSNARTLDEFIGKVNFCQITNKAYNRFNK